MIAMASIAAGAINLAAAATIGPSNAQYLAFFTVVGVAQVAWAAVALAWAPRWWLALGAGPVHEPLVRLPLLIPQAGSTRFRALQLQRGA